MTALADRDPGKGTCGAAMSAPQATIVAVMVGLNAPDGFDGLAISFAAPGTCTNGRSPRTLGALVSGMASARVVAHPDSGKCGTEKRSAASVD